MHSVEFLGYGWDVARAIGAADRLDHGLCEIGLAIARRWPDNAWGPAGPFRDQCPYPRTRPRTSA